MTRFFFSHQTKVVKFIAQPLMNDDPPKQSRRDLGHKILMGSLCLGLLVFFIVLVLNMSDKGALNKYERQWEAKGEHFDFASYVPKPVPDDQNFALTPIVASCYQGRLDKPDYDDGLPNTNFVNRLEMRIPGSGSDWTYSTNNGNWAKGKTTSLKAFQLYYRALAARTNEFPVAPQMQSPAADVLLALSKYDATIEELRQAAALPESRFPLKYDSEYPATINLPHLSALKSCCQVLELRAVAELQNGQSESALADVKLMLRLIDSIHTEPFLITHLVRIALLNLTLQPVWEGLQDHKWSDAQLVELNQELAKQDFLADYEFSLRGERVLSMANIEYIRRTRNFGLFAEGENSPSGFSKAAYHLIPNSLFYQNELAIARGIQEWFLPVADVGQHVVSPQRVELATTNIDQMRVHWSPNTVLAAMMLPGLERSSQRFAYAQSSVDMARVACALERFRLANGEYPETLDAVQPRFIASLPHDVIGGQSLKYHRNGDGTFALYSVGWNGTDDGGAVVFKKLSKTSIDLENGDWVWTGQIMGSQ
jgi:hypothetical protein